MNVERVRTLLLSLPGVVETMQWGENLVFWVGDKAAGGKMFALLALDASEGTGGPLLSFAAGPEGFAELCEREGVVPAPYLARAHWVAVTRWDVFTGGEWQTLLPRAHALVLAKLTRRAREALTGTTAKVARGKSLRDARTNKRGGGGVQSTGGAGASSGKNTAR